MTAAAPRTPRVHVVMRKEELDPSRLAGKVVVVIDVLFATSTIAAALHAGAREVIPVPTVDEARRTGARYPGDGCLLCGEQSLARIPGFAGFTPSALTGEPLLPGRTVVYCTTNGTVALDTARSAPDVYAGCLLNASAVAAHVNARHPAATVLLACAGSEGRFNLEDFYGAGCLVDALLQAGPDARELTDAAAAALNLYRTQDAVPCLQSGRLGRRLGDTEHAADVTFAARRDTHPVVPRLVRGSLRVVGGERAGAQRSMA